MRADRRVTKPIVAIMKDRKEEDSLTKALDLLPIKEIIREGDRVVIVPNWVKNKPPVTGSVVGPNTLKRLIRYVKNFKPSRITIATGSGGDPTPTVMNSVGYNKVIEEEMVEFVDLNYGPYIDLKLEHCYIRQTKINNLINDIDVLVSFTQLKHHEEAAMSAGIKNIALGWPPAEIHGFPKKNLGIHEDLHGFILSMAKKIPIDLTIVSADKAMIGTGPSSGMTVNGQGLVIAGTDPVAVDTIGARLLGFLPQAVYYLYQAYKSGIGEARPENMELKGLMLEEAERFFSMSAYKTEIVLDKGEIKDIHGNH
ncbi:DUF362 domain-containing protein [Wukongibacter baidiensis]|uniref:DUF362 domain-containing protein n=1 Tax=Wukongibacter baidiensis TaxID=1723361 RepID=UPI003D7FDBCC